MESGLLVSTFENHPDLRDVGMKESWNSYVGTDAGVRHVRMHTQSIGNGVRTRKIMLLLH